MSNNPQIREIHIKVPTEQVVELSSFYATLPFYFHIFSHNPDRRTLEARRQKLVEGYASYSFEEIKEVALKVFRGKKLLGVANETEFLAEVEKWRVYHYNASELSSR